MKLNNFLKLVGALVICQLAGVIGSSFSLAEIKTWYPTLHMPPLNPPTWVFGPVWTGLYLLMGVALYLVWERGAQTPAGKRAMRIFGFQLVLNALWPIVFFTWHDSFHALLVIIVLWFSILKSIISFRAVSETAGWLLWPYLAWTTFAVYLNFALWVLNR